jgi:hypothetical protein
MIESTIVGLCTNHEDPDLWFSDTSSSESGRGRTKLDEEKVMVERTIQALSICNQCPVKLDCLQEGMKPQHSEYGVWGGTLPGERMIDRGLSHTSSEVKKRMRFAKIVREAQLLLQN